MSTQPTAVLVHGAFADASGFAGVIRRLQAQGVQVRAPMNPLRGLASDAEAIVCYTTAIEGPVVLVGHSYGGAVISHAAPAVKDVRALVFLAAFGLDEGDSCASVMEPFPPSMLASTNVASSYDAPGAVGGPDLFIKIENFRETFCADLSEDVAGPMAVSQRPLAAAAFTEAATVIGWKNLPSWYLVSEHDNAIPPDCERFMAQRMGAVTESVDGSHAAFIAQPDIASSLILKALTSV
ncbi:MAG TPA: alpha/beta hydrolase [Streptosporangiaceae bacterium]